MCCVECFISLSHHNTLRKGQYDYLYFLTDEEPRLRNVISLAQVILVRKEVYIDLFNIVLDVITPLSDRVFDVWPPHYHGKIS